MQYRVEMNWPRSADIVIEETVKLDQLGIPVPPLAKTAAQMRLELKQNQEDVTILINHYHQAHSLLEALL